MALGLTLDITNDFNKTSLKNVDLSGWDSAVVQLVAPSGTINFLSSNDNGEPSTTASTFEGAPITAANFTAVQGTNLATGTAVTSLATGGLVKFNGIGRFLQLSGTSITATKILIFLSKIS